MARHVAMEMGVMQIHVVSPGYATPVVSFMKDAALGIYVVLD